MSAEDTRSQQPSVPIVQCMGLANAMSCETMTRMAKREVSENFQRYAYFGSTPACEMYRHLADREAEMRILAGNGLSKKMCFNPKTFPTNGEWTSQFDNERKVPVCFDAQTRIR
jgi:hypothetical protein